jgi:hypothetical protein
VRPFDYMVKAGQTARQKVFPGWYATGKICKSRVDSPSPRSTRKWSRTAHPATRNFPDPTRCSYIKVAALILRPLNLQGEHHAFHDDHFFERLRKCKAGTVPDLKDMEAMRKYNEQLKKAGVLLAVDGLTQPSTMSARVTFKSGKSKVTDGLFTEAKEVVGGFWIIQVKSREEALEWASRIPG